MLQARVASKPLLSDDFLREAVVEACAMVDEEFHGGKSSRICEVVHAIPCHSMPFESLEWHDFITLYIYIYHISIHFAHFFPMQSLFFIDFHRPSVI